MPMASNRQRKNWVFRQKPHQPKIAAAMVSGRASELRKPQLHWNPVANTKSRRKAITEGHGNVEDFSGRALSRVGIWSGMVTLPLCGGYSVSDILRIWFSIIDHDRVLNLQLWGRISLGCSFGFASKFHENFRENECPRVGHSGYR